MSIIKTDGSNKNNKKVFLDATVYAFFDVVSFEFYLLVVFSILVVGGCLYLVFKTVAESGVTNMPPSSRITATIILFILLLTLTVIRRYWTFKVITSNDGLTLVGLLKKRHIKWTEITGINTSCVPLTGRIADFKSGRITTRRGKYFFPLTMREKGQLYPQLKGKLMDFSWIGATGTTKEITLQSCPLYEEIQEHLTAG